MRTLANFHVLGERIPGKTGVWTTHQGRARKLASIGIAVRRWVTLHGLALNVNTDLARFAAINPCGMTADVMTSMAEILGHTVPLPSVEEAIARHLGALLGREFRPVDLADFSAAVDLSELSG